MPPLQPVPNVLKAQFQWSDSTDLTVFNNFFFGYTGGQPSEADAVSLASALFTAMTAFQTSWGTSTALTGCTVTDLTSSSAAQGEHSGNALGQDDHPDLAGGTALVIGYQIARRYRGGKPRNYFPWGTTVDLASRQQWNQTFITQVTNQWATWIGEAIGATGGATTINRHVNVSYYEGSRVVMSPTTGRARNVPIPRAVPVVDTINGFVVRPGLGSQRRRNRG